MDREEQKEKLEEFIKPALESFPVKARDSELNSALYSFGENSMITSWMDGLDNDDAIRIWAIVESVRVKGFPEELEM